MTEKHPCSKRVFGGERCVMRGHLCCFAGVVFEDGKWWCKKHSPSFLAAKEAARQANFKAKNDARDAKWKAQSDWNGRAKACVKACDGMADPVVEVVTLKRKCEAGAKLATAVAVGTRDEFPDALLAYQEACK